MSTHVYRHLIYSENSIYGRRLARPQSYLSKIEHGERRLDVGEYIALCRAMGADPVEIMAKVVAALPKATKRP